MLYGVEWMEDGERMSLLYRSREAADAIASQGHRFHPERAYARYDVLEAPDLMDRYSNLRAAAAEHFTGTVERHGGVLICDVCGHQEVLDGRSWPSGWRRDLRGDVCPDCA